MSAVGIRSETITRVVFPIGLAVEQLQGLDLVFVFLDELAEARDERLRFLFGCGVGASAKKLVARQFVDYLLPRLLSFQHRAPQLRIEKGFERPAHPLVLDLVGLFFRRPLTLGKAEFFGGVSGNGVGIDAGQKVAAERGKVFATGGLRDLGFLLRVDVALQAGQSRGERGDDVGIGCAGGNEVQQLVERDGGLAVT